MKLRVFHAGKGDGLMLTSDSGANVLIDAGMPNAFTENIQPFLATMAKKKEVLDLVYVSHIDRDHIGGVVRLLDNIMAWRVYDYRAARGDKIKAPAVPRMPEVKGIWHNAFSDLIGNNAAAAGDLMAQSAGVLAQSADPDIFELATEHSDLAYSVDDAINVSRRISADQLGIPLNEPFGGRLIIVRDPPGVEATVGGLSITVIGPFEDDVERLKKDWNQWLRDHKELVAKLRAKAHDDAGKLLESGSAGSPALDIELKQLGQRSRVTPPNLASVMLLVEENGTRLLLTGDGHADDIIAGLEHHKVFPGGSDVAHFEVLKIQHHGAEYNIHEEFCRRVTADHYVFCGNGEHENPDFAAVEVIFTANATYRPGASFKVWFNCDDNLAPPGKARAHMKELMARVQAHVAASGGKARASFATKTDFIVQ